MNAPDWHTLHHADALAHHAVEIQHGLSEDEAAARLARHGPNQPPAPPGRSTWARLADQLVAPLVLVLIAAGAVTAFLGEWVDAGVILGVVVVNALIGFLQEGKAAAALAALARSVATEVTVLRGGRRRRMNAVHLVPGDIVHLAAGDKVPADLRVLRGKELRTVEAALTGESLPVDKHHHPLPIDTPLAERRNMAYAGTTVVSGQGAGLVVATGAATETGRISTLIASAPDLATPLTRKMAAFAKLLLWAILALAGLTFAIGIARGERAFDMFMAAVALAVGAIPEGLPAAITITLAIGVARMAKRRAIVRQLPAVEALGSTTVICSDKTGTLTENAMTVRALWADGQLYEITGHGYAPTGELRLNGAKVGAGETASSRLAANMETAPRAVEDVLLAGLLCNDAALHHEHGEWIISGDPTEAALIVAAKKAGLDEATIAALFPRLDELPFEAARQTMATLHRIEDERVVYVKGAVEKLLPACAGANPDAIESAARDMARQGLRVLALCRRPASADFLLPSDLDSGLGFLGLVGMIDPPRPRAIAAVKACHAAGIQVKMITGDHADTALAIAHQLNITRNGGHALTGRQLAALDDMALAAAVRTVDVFARVEPEQKLRLVRALRQNGEIVAMTGDGVNDAPALKSADIGIAMGMGGTEVAKEAAAMVLTDDNFATIEAAVEEGRGIFDNLVKFITWTLPTNFGEGLVILAAIVAGATLPITPLQILWINMTTAVLLGLPLAFEPVEGKVMHRPPRPPQAPILDRVLIQRIVLVGTLMLAASFGLFLLALERGQSLAEARSIAVNVFVMIELAYLFNCRSLARPLWRVAPFSNPWVWGGAASMLLLQLAFTYLPVFQQLFGTAPIGAQAWLEIAAVSFAAMLLIEGEKTLRKRQTHIQAIQHQASTTLAANPASCDDISHVTEPPPDDRPETSAMARPASGRGQPARRVSGEGAGLHAELDGAGKRAGGSGKIAGPSDSTQPLDATRELATAAGPKPYSEVAEALAENVARCLDELLELSPEAIAITPGWLQSIHQRIAGTLFPDWAGRWRGTEVQVGTHLPPAPRDVPVHVKNFCLDLEERLRHVEDARSLAELMAWVDWRFQWIHPFKDFNGRVGRILLVALTYKLGLPPVDPALSGADKAKYFEALRSADQNDLRPLTDLWLSRLGT